MFQAVWQDERTWYRPWTNQDALDAWKDAVLDLLANTRVGRQRWAVFCPDGRSPLFATADEHAVWVLKLHSRHRSWTLVGLDHEYGGCTVWGAVADDLYEAVDTQFLRAVQSESSDGGQ
ncbi:hypothetical protein [Pseudomonas sp.]|uniref:hypothetical protein n=1 Tax=Pseudomonas sp. TaxID=306 RepID=UPI003D123853